MAGRKLRTCVVLCCHNHDEMAVKLKLMGHLARGLNRLTASAVMLTLLGITVLLCGTRVATAETAAPVFAESSTRLKQAAPDAEIEEAIQASLSAALADLDKLEL